MSVIEVEAKEKWDTGSIRNSREGKGRYDLIGSFIGFDIIIDSPDLSPYDSEIVCAFKSIREFINTKNKNNLYSAFHCVARAIDLESGIEYSYLERLARHYENGANIYSDRNWEKGQNVQRYIDSSLRHCKDSLQHKSDEDHAAAVMWNIIALDQTINMIECGLLPKELDDRPNYIRN